MTWPVMLQRFGSGSDVSFQQSLLTLLMYRSTVTIILQIKTWIIPNNLPIAMSSTENVTTFCQKQSQCIVYLFHTVLDQLENSANPSTKSTNISVLLEEAL